MSPGQKSVDQWLAENYTPPFKRQEFAHDPLCPWDTEDFRGNSRRCECRLIARVRADERTKWLKWAAKDACCEAGFVASPDPCPWHPDGIRERLRAQVEALPQHEFLVGSPLAGGGWAQYATAGVRRSDVLRLLGVEP